MTTHKRLFGTNGIRGIPGRDLTLEFISEMGLSIGSFFGKGDILIGFDGRNSSPSISRAIAAGMMESGLDITDAGLIPTPALQLAIRNLSYDGGVMITASHNPSEYNGIKALSPSGVEITRDDEIELENIYYEKRYRRVKWNEVGHRGHDEKVIKNYIDSVVKHVDSQRIRDRKLTIVIDVGNGAQALSAPYIAERLACRVITLNGHVDGNLPGRGGEPTPDTLRDLSDSVKVYGADIGVGYDGDGDRSIFCDEKGEIFWGDKSGTLITGHVLESKRVAPVVTTIATSLIVDEIVKRYGSQVFRTRVGSVDVSYKMQEVNAIFGLEENGGCFYAPHMEVRDGGMATALMLELLAYSKKTLSSLLAELPSFFQSKTRFSCPIEKATMVLDIIANDAKGKVDKIDGVKIWEDDHSWILLRPSGTEPLLRLFGESNDIMRLEKMMSQYSDKVKSIMKTLS